MNIIKSLTSISQINKITSIELELMPALNALLNYDLQVQRESDTKKPVLPFCLFV